MNDITLAVKDGRAVVTSHTVAKHFNKRHTHVLRAIENLECSDEFRQRNFGLTSNVIAMPNGGSREEKAFEMTRDGFSFLAMGFTGKEAAQWKERYIVAFNAMEATINAPTAQVPAPYDFAGKLNRISDPAMRILFEQALAYEALREEQAVLAQRVTMLEVKAPQENQFFSVLGYARLKGIAVPLNKANAMGRIASKKSRELGYEIGTTTDPRFGRVNTYHVDILDMFTEEPAHA